jgi:hypothetical protein
MIDDKNLQNTSEFRALILERIDNVRQSVEEVKNGYTEFKDAMWGKVGSHQDRLTKIEGSLEILNKIVWAIAIISIGAILTAAFKKLLSQ